jgi:hypothetical protein
MVPGPVFIGGLDRSGKTLVRLSLSIHPSFAFTRRTYFWTRFYRRYGDLSQPENFERCFSAILESKHINELHPNPDRIRREFWQGAPTYGRLFALFHEHHAERLSRRRWGDQLRFIEYYADPIFSAYPDAKIIHMIRDPRDRYEASMPPDRHSPGKVGWSTARWLFSMKLAKRNREKFPDGYKVVRYEDLVNQPEATLREVCSFLGEDYLPALLLAAGQTRGRDEIVKQDEYRSRSRPAGTALMDKGFHLISSRESAFIQAYAYRELLDFGYPLDRICFSRRDRFLYHLLDWPANRAGMVAWNAIKKGRPD